MNDNITLRDIADLIYAAEDMSPRLGRLEARLLSHNRETSHLYRELEVQAQDCGVEVGSSQWSLAAVDLSEQLEQLLDATHPSGRQPTEILDPEGVLGIDVDGLVRICRSRLARHEPRTQRLRQVLDQLLTMATAKTPGEKALP